MLLGELASLILDGQYMLPKRLLDLGFRFHFEKAEPVLRDLLIGSSR
jgi:NAD dependent epimerase/dehydratase family enzyme